MENTPITNYNELLLRISQVKEERSIQKVQLKYAFEEFRDTLNPISIVKGSLNKLVNDKETHVSLAKAGLNLGTNFIIEKVLGRSRSLLNRRKRARLFATEFASRTLAGSCRQLERSW